MTNYCKIFFWKRPTHQSMFSNWRLLGIFQPFTCSETSTAVLRYPHIWSTYRRTDVRTRCAVRTTKFVYNWGLKSLWLTILIGKQWADRKTINQCHLKIYLRVNFSNNFNYFIFHTFWMHSKKRQRHEKLLFGNRMNQRPRVLQFTYEIFNDFIDYRLWITVLPTIDY